MTYNIRVGIKTDSIHLVKLKDKQKIKATLDFMPKRLNELLDVDVSGVKDNYVIMYDSSIGKYIAVNPDEVLIASAVEIEQPGIPVEFIDNIELDGGEF